jgi:hypothetical protein
MILKILQNGGRGLTRQLKVNPAATPNRQPHSTGGLERKMGIAVMGIAMMGIAIVPLCQHRMDNATRCGCPAMKGTRYCYSHHRQQARAARKNAERARQRWFESAPLEDAASVQRALTQVMTRLVSGEIDHRQAGQILYKLQTASVNLKSARSDPAGEFRRDTQ